jgi:hypothetical protein
VHYNTGLTSPRNQPLCSANAGANGKFQCSGAISSTTSGTRLITAKGDTSGKVGQAYFLLTT